MSSNTRQRRGGRTTPAVLPDESKSSPGAPAQTRLTSDAYKHKLPDVGAVRGWDRHFTVTLVFWACLAVGSYYLWRVVEASPEKEVVLQTLGITCTTASVLACSLICMIGCCFGGRSRSRLHIASRPRSQEEYSAVGLGPTKDQSPEELYLDMVKRTVVNTIYQDLPQWLYDNRKQAFLSDGFDLEYRVRGEDVPRVAHTMVGFQRLSNVQQLVTDCIKRGVPGDVIETGVYRGGTTIFMKAILRAYGEEDRRVWVCDTFQPQPPPPGFLGHMLALPLMRLFSSIPGGAWRRFLFDQVQNATSANNMASFPSSENPSDNAIDVVMFVLRHVGAYAHSRGTSLDEVREAFVRYGLLDENVKFLKGFFSDTIPGAGIEKLSVVRLDGDTYESTMTALEPLYPKLSVGGYVIVDDYNSFSDCQTAIDEYRTKHNITSPLIPIDNLSVYWQKTE